MRVGRVTEHGQWRDGGDAEGAAVVLHDGEAGLEILVSIAGQHTPAVREMISGYMYTYIVHRVWDVFL